MADDTLPPSSEPAGGGRGSSRGPSRGPREGREPGGFRIRLSDNEMQAARALQEAFGLRSTVAVLGFSLRTLAQQLAAGQLDALVAEQKAQAGPRGGGGSDGGGRREGERRGGREQGRAAEVSRTPRANPFARPSRPPAPAPLEEACVQEAPGITDLAEESSSTPAEGAEEVLIPAAEASAVEPAAEPAEAAVEA